MYDTAFIGNEFGFTKYNKRFLSKTVPFPNETEFFVHDIQNIRTLKQLRITGVVDCVKIGPSVPFFKTV
jgi:hypothetical protein